ncbi:unnamed protein product [Ceutorhynchus assimilis]|uniref:Uncharacterized protein n=1 Tax=Ceutorhynchus assimilis TaxID=467358 RepID=A0A9N9MRH9_9CUCU|nr:unnamed protein product [Ceutorhynchus assimilis]
MYEPENLESEPEQDEVLADIAQKLVLALGIIIPLRPSVQSAAIWSVLTRKTYFQTR